MADVRALLAAERQSRRISHPHLTYAKNGTLICNVCNLNVKSEQLWPGHLKSANHRKNVLQKVEAPTRPAKRKLEEVEDADSEGDRTYEVDSRKKPKAVSDTQAASESPRPPEPFVAEPSQVQLQPEPQLVVDMAPANSPLQPSAPAQPEAAPAAPSNPIDEDEWAAFEREIAETEVQKPDYGAATIEAAPVSASELAAQTKVNAVQQKEDEAEAEKEDESRRMEEEFEVMEEMENRVKNLRARREALRTQDPTTTGSEAGPAATDNIEAQVATAAPAEEDSDSDENDEDDDDDWYG